MSFGHRGFHVEQYRPWRFWLLGLFIVLAFYGFFIFGQIYQAYELKRLRLETETLKIRISDVESRNSNLVAKNAHLSGSSKIEHDAYQLANQALIKQQEEILAIKEELAFYRGIVSPGSSDLAMKLQSFEVTSKNGQDLFGYKLILTKSGKSTRKVQGKVDIIFRGEAAGVKREFHLSEISTEKIVKADTFSFRYFQIFEGELLLPQTFVPYEVEIRINPSTKKLKSITESISWTTIMSEDH